MEKIKKLNYIWTFYLIIALIGILFFGLVSNDTKYVLSITICIISLILFQYYYLKTKDIFNPDGLFSLVWLFSVALSQLKLSSMQFDWNGKVWFVVILSWVAYLIGSSTIDLVSKKKLICFQPKKNIELNPRKLKKNISILFFLSFLSFVIEVVVAGYIPIFSSNMGAYTGFGISFIHYNTVAISVVVLMCFYYILTFKKDQIIIFLMIIGIFQIISIVSRQLIVFTFFGCLVLLHYKKKKISIIRLAKYGLLALVIFGVMGTIRNQSLEYLYDVANIKEEVPQSFLMWPYLYFSMGFENLRSFIVSDIDFQLGRLTFEPIWALTRFKTIFNPINLAQYHTIPEFNVSTYLREYYIDFGIAGILFIPYITGIFTKLIYMRMERKELYLLIYIFILHNLVFTFFVNFYSNTSVMINLIYIVLIYNFSKNTSSKMDWKS